VLPALDHKKVVKWSGSMRSVLQDKIYSMLSLILGIVSFQNVALADQSNWFFSVSVGQYSVEDFTEDGVSDLAQFTHNFGMGENYTTETINIEDSNNTYSVGLGFRSSIANVSLSYIDFGKLQANLTQNYDNGCPNQVLSVGGTVGCRPYSGQIGYDFELKPKALELSISKDFVAYKDLIMSPKIVYVQWDIGSEFQFRDQGVTGYYRLNGSGDIVQTEAESSINNSVSGEIGVSDNDIGLGLEVSHGVTDDVDINLGWTRYLDGDGDTNVILFGVSWTLNAVSRSK